LGLVAPDVTYITRCPTLDRGLLLWRAKYPHVDSVQYVKRLGAHTDPRSRTGDCPCLKGESIRYNKEIAIRCMNGTSRREEVSVEDVIGHSVYALLAHSRRAPEQPFWRTAVQSLRGSENLLKVFDLVTASVFKRCQFDKILTSSDLVLSSFAVVGRSEAGSYCMVKLQTGDQTRFVPAYIRYFLLLNWHGTDTMDRFVKVNRIQYRLDASECEAFGQQVFRFDPSVDVSSKNGDIVSVDSIVRPLILIKPVPGPSRCMSRLVQFEG
jgi:hypothetical protein